MDIYHRLSLCGAPRLAYSLREHPNFRVEWEWCSCF